MNDFLVNIQNATKERWVGYVIFESILKITICFQSSVLVVFFSGGDNKGGKGDVSLNFIYMTVLYFCANNELIVIWYITIFRKEEIKKTAKAIRKKERVRNDSKIVLDDNIY